MNTAGRCVVVVVVLMIAGCSRLGPADVERFAASRASALAALDADALCASYDDGAKIVMGADQKVTLDKAAFCRWLSESTAHRKPLQPLLNHEVTVTKSKLAWHGFSGVVELDEMQWIRRGGDAKALGFKTTVVADLRSSSKGARVTSERRTVQTAEPPKQSEGNKLGVEEFNQVLAALVQQSQDPATTPAHKEDLRRLIALMTVGAALDAEQSAEPPSPPVDPRSTAAELSALARECEFRRKTISQAKQWLATTDAGRTPLEVAGMEEGLKRDIEFVEGRCQ